MSSHSFGNNLVEDFHLRKSVDNGALQVKTVMLHAAARSVSFMSMFCRVSSPGRVVR